MRVRRIAIVIVAVQLLIPTVLLGVRVADPSVGPQPFGWQMWSGRWR